MPSLGSKKKDNLSRMDRHSKDVPQLTNEMQLSIMNKVKSGELSIDGALKLARKDLLKDQTPNNEIDFKTSMLCSIEKGIVKKQLPFSIVKSSDDGVGSRFSISFKGRHDYELEATSVEDKQKMIQLVNRIIYRNIYNDPEERNSDTGQQPQASQSIRKGDLLLHRGGLASFKWVKYDAQLHPGQLTLIPFRKQGPADSEATAPGPESIVVHLSDGDTSVQKLQGSDTFSLITHKNEYQFKVPATEQTSAPEAVQSERDAWVQDIDRLCSDWKKKYKDEHVLMKTKVQRNHSITEEAEENNTDLESNGGFSGENKTIIYPPAENANADSTSVSEDCLSAGDTSHPSADYTKPHPKPRRSGKAAAGVTGSDVLPPVPLPTSPDVVASSSPTLPPIPPPQTASMSPSTVPEPPSHESGSSAVTGPPPPSAPPPPPLLFKAKANLTKPCTKAFHWDLVSSEKIAKSFWTQGSSGRPEIDTSRLCEQFAIKDMGKFGAAELSNTQHIMLNKKIAHNFNIFLKSFPVQPGELKDKLFIINKEDGGLSDEHITSLRRYVPTMDDVEMYKSYSGPVTELHIVDRYMMELCNIPNVSTQLNMLLTLRELPISMNDLQPLINQKIRMCTQLCNCRSFVVVLEYLLAIGNYLNENAGKEKAKGFRLSSLTKLSQLRGRDKKFTLLNALVEQIMLHEPCLATFTQELAEFETVPGASIKGLTAEVDVLKNELQKVIQYRKTCKKRNAGVHPPNFLKDLKMTIEKYKTDLSALMKTCEEMKNLYSVTLVKFGEPAEQDSQEFFGVISQFVHDFKRAHAEIL
ncbi:formin-like protein 13 isoform X2 [Anabas testudineus]|uniref:formin-like protein 13 isoform X2 n=1 Tax=Anabas testudineus TaxID=64144 RepID=UPI000E45EAEF|nr:formin-like protein 13 isoform X2 [Anabas testudineus]